MDNSWPSSIKKKTPFHTILNVYAPNNGTSKYMKQKPQRKIDNFIIILEDVHTPILKNGKKKVSRKPERM